MANGDHLVMAAIRLRGEAPAAWEEFLQALRTYQAQVITDFIRCPPEQLHKAQGMTQMVGELTTMLTQAPNLKEKMERRHG